jgi:signal transduction histidine kinase/ligand-binding sensor domain-containing protein
MVPKLYVMLELKKLILKQAVYKIPLFLFLLLCARMPAQDFSYQTFNASDGLPTSEIISLYKDSKGFLWVGTTLGVSRYDGYSFENFQSASGGHVIGNVICIKEDSRKKLWIGSHAGLFFLENSQIYKANLPESDLQGINDIFPEEDGSIWLATENGPAHINALVLNNCKKDPIDLKKFIMQEWPSQNDNTDGRRATQISRALDGTIFISNFYEIYRYENKHISRLFSERDIEKNFTIFAVFPVSRNKIYFNEAKLGMHKIENGTITQIPFKQLYRPAANVSSAFVWYPDVSGFYKFYPQEETVTFYFNTFNIDVTWLSNMLYDESGFYWVATHDGLIKVKPALFKKYPLKTFYNVQEVYSFGETSDGKFLLGANRGKLYLREADNFRYFFPNQQRIVPLAEIFDIYEDERKWLWFGTGYQGIAVYRNGKITRYMAEDGMHDDSIKKFFKSSDGKLYAIGDFGLTEIIVDKKDSVYFKKYKARARISQYGSFFGAIEAPDHTIWLGGEEGLAYLKNDSVHAYKVNGRDLYVNDIKKEKTGNVWITTGGEGLLYCTFNEEGNLDLIKKYTERDGLNTSTFMSVLPARDGNIWVSSPRGISFIGLNGPNKNKVLNFDEKDGFIKSGYNNLKLSQDKKGIIWAGCSKGLTSFNPDSIVISAQKPLVYITSISLLNSKESINIFADSMKGNLPVNLSLPYNKNSVHFNYTSIEFNNSKALRYFYQLVGFDTGWIYARNERNVSYQNLKPGRYKFIVKSINDKFLWSEKEASLDFVISPPFWQRWWFIGLCVLAIAVVIYQFYHFFRQKYEAQKTLNRFITALYGKNTPEEIFRSIAYNCIHQLGFVDCVIYQLNEERKVLIQKAAAGPKSPEGYEIINPIEIPVGKGIVGAVAKTGKAEIISNTRQDPRYIVDDARRLSEITIPILVDGEVYGIIDSEHPRKRFYKKRHQYILQTIANICAIRITKYLTEEKLRSKIARDLHDDMGSTLSSINIISKMALQNNDNDMMAKEYLSKIKDNSGRMLESMSDIVWAINPANDTVEKVILRMKEFAAEMLEPMNIGYTFKEKGDFDNALLNLNQRKDFYLIFKEAINNAAKYSKCTEVNIELIKNDYAITLLVKDNGKGFDKKNTRSGNGLRNMQSRSAAMKADLQISTENGKGVSVYLSVPLENKAAVT